MAHSVVWMKMIWVSFYWFSKIVIVGIEWKREVMVVGGVCIAFASFGVSGNSFGFAILIMTEKTRWPAIGVNETRRHLARVSGVLHRCLGNLLVHRSLQFVCIFFCFVGRARVKWSSWHVEHIILHAACVYLIIWFICTHSTLIWCMRLEVRRRRRHILRCPGNNQAKCVIRAWDCYALCTM